MNKKTIVANELSSDQIIYQNETALNELTSNLSFGLEALQRIEDGFFALTQKYLTVSEIADFYNHGQQKYMVPKLNEVDEYIKTQLIKGKSGAISGVTIDENKLYDLVQLPDLTNLHEALRSLLFVPEVALREVFFWHCYTEINGKISLVPKEVERVKEQFRAYAIGPKEKRKLALVKKVCHGLNLILKENRKEIDKPEKLIINGLLTFDANSMTYRPTETFIKYGLSNRLIFNINISNDEKD